MKSTLPTRGKRVRSRGAFAFAAFAIAAGSALPLYGATTVTATVSAPPTTATPVVHNPQGKLLGVVESRPTMTSSASGHREARAAAQSPVTYHGGPVMHSSAVYPIFWAQAGYSFPSGYLTTIAQYFLDVTQDSYLPSNVYGATTQYYETAAGKKKFVSYLVSNKPGGNDTRAFPKNGCPNYTLGDGSTSKVCLTNAQIDQEITFIVSSHNLPSGLGTQIFLFTPKGVASCENATALSKGGCYDPLQYNGYCAYHSHLGSGAQAVLYANMPYNALPGCSSGQSPNGNAADAVLNNVGHEHNETITDPLGTGWFDSGGGEIADKCHLKFGKPLGATQTGKFNQVINANRYWLQQLWSNRAKACVQRNTYPQPIATITYTPPSPEPRGTKVAFKSNVHQAGETTWTYRWTFPDGGTATVANPTHKFTSFILGGQVLLIVTDKHGDQTRTGTSITVQ